MAQGQPPSGCEFVARKRAWQVGLPIGARTPDGSVLVSTPVFSVNSALYVFPKGFLVFTLVFLELCMPQGSYRSEYLHRAARCGQGFDLSVFLR